MLGEILSQALACYKFLPSFHSFKYLCVYKESHVLMEKNTREKISSPSPKLITTQTDVRSQTIYGSEDRLL